MLDARTAKLDAKLKATEDRLGSLEDKTKKTDEGFKKFAGGAKVAGTAAVALATAALALSAAISTIVISSAKGRRELEILAKQAKTSTSDFQALAFATSRYGIDAAKMGDASKDIADRIGEFAAAGTGVFQDYADTMKLSKDAAMEAAQEFEGLSSQEILGTMVSRMEDAGVSGDKMLFVMESLANDASKLIPLFSNNSKELLTLKARFNDVNDALQITGTQAAALQDVSDTFTLMTSSVGNATTAISATLAPVLDDFFNDIIAIVPDATQTVIDFINSFLDAENITSIAAVNKEITASMKEIAMQKGIIDKDLNPRATKAAKSILRTENERLEALKAQLVVLTDQEKKIQDADRLRGGEIGGETVTPVKQGEPIGTGDQIKAIEDRFKLEETLLAEKLVREIQIVGENSETRLQLEQEFADNIYAIRNKSREEEEKAYQEEIAKKAKLDEEAGKAKIALESSVANNAIELLQMIGGENKAAALAALVIQKATALSANATATLSGSMLAFASQVIPGDPTSIVRAEAARNYVTGLGALNAGLIVATGLGQAAGITSGGSSGGIGGGSSSSSSQSQPYQANFERETTSLEFTNTSSSGSATNTIKFATDSGDELLDTIAKLLNKGKQEGRFA